MQRRHLAPLLGLAALAAAYGCAGGGLHPLAPTDSPEGQGSTPAPFGHYQITIDNDQASLVALSSGQAFADARSYDATEYFTSAPCADCVRIDAIGKTPEGKLALDIGIRHPFSEIDARLDLDAFDVRGILGVDGVVSFPGTDGILERPLTTDPAVLLNADGYTTHYFESLTAGDATLNPFRRFFTEDDPAPDEFGDFINFYKMPMGSGWDVRRYVLEPVGGPITYDFLIEVSYGQSARSPFNGTPAEDAGGWLNPQYWNPEFNQKEAFSTIFSVDETPAANEGGSLKLSASAMDWQVGYVVDETYPNADNLYGIRASSNIAGYQLEIPGLNIDTTEATTAEGSGAAWEPMALSWDLTLGTFAEGKYPALFTVVDELYDPETIETSQDDMRAFQVKQVKLQENVVVGEAPVAVLGSVPSPANAILRDANFQFIGANSYDPDLVELTLFEFDFDYDGATFDVDFSATSPGEAVPFHTYAEPGDYVVALRVANADGEQSEIDTRPVHVDPNPIVPSPEVTWSNGVNITPEFHLPQLTLASSSAIGYGPNGNIHVIYTEEEEGVFLGIDVYVYHVEIPPSGVPTGPEEIYHEVVLDSTSTQSAMAIGPNNKLAVVYSLDQEIFFTEKSGSTWSEPFICAASDGFGGESLGSYDLAISADNDLALAFETFYPTSELPAKLYVTFRNGSSWVAENTIGTGWGVSQESTGTMWPSITRNGSGFVAAWAGGPATGDFQQDVSVRRFDGEEWLPRETIANDPALGESSPHVAVANDGTIAVAYRTGLGIYGKVARNGGAFGNTLTLFENGTAFEYSTPVMIAGNNGALACVALEKEGEFDPGTIVTLAFSKDHSDPSFFGLRTRGLAVNNGPVYYFPDGAGNGTTGLAVVTELQHENWTQLRLIRGVFGMP